MDVKIIIKDTHNTKMCSILMFQKLLTVITIFLSLKYNVILYL